MNSSEKYDEAIPIYKIALAIEPKNPRLLFGLSQSLTFTNNLEEAILVLDTAIMLEDQFAPFYSNRGLLKYKLKQNNEAVSDFKISIKLDSTNSTYYYNLSLPLFYLGRYRESCEALDIAKQMGLKHNNYILKQIRRKCK